MPNYHAYGATCAGFTQLFFNAVPKRSHNRPIVTKKGAEGQRDKDQRRHPHWEPDGGGHQGGHPALLHHRAGLLQGQAGPEKGLG